MKYYCYCIFNFVFMCKISNGFEILYISNNNLKMIISINDNYYLVNNVFELRLCSFLFG